MIGLLESRFSVTFRPGVNYFVGCIRPNLDPVEAFYRPLAIYLGIYFLRFAFTRYLVFLKGFKRTSLGCLVYYTNTSPNKGATPLVFVHGLGLGLTCYVTLIQALHTIQRPVFLVELPFIVIRLHQHSAPSPETLVRAIETMLDHHAHPKAVILAHSLGTVIATWVALRAPQRLAGMILVDPVCFLLNYHHIAFNILHRVPQRWIESFFQYGAMRELSISHYISRQFYWYQSVLFPNEKMAPMAVYLSEKDTIIDSQLVADYLQAQNMDVHLMPGLQHAGFLIDVPWRDEILAKINKMADLSMDEAIQGEL
ncbi:Alpha/Beta hydrolase protein [Syncephalastrum racemosum]|uniref:Alpha/Beta hydrolase protein n=1 Tax=Syncephalastrum racemosum TaxID=13706 RepID=A0A1X2H5T5_SYNRA|nr:Alpha/Beta hydrolase protein [Syncephalastrum racemosum]